MQYKFKKIKTQNNVRKSTGKFFKYAIQKFEKRIVWNLGVDHQISKEGGWQLPKKIVQGKIREKKSCKSATTKKITSIGQKKSCISKATKKIILHKKSPHPPPQRSDGAPLN